MKANQPSLTEDQLDEEVKHQPVTARPFVDTALDAAKMVGAGVLGAGAALTNMKVAPLRKVD